MHSGDLLAMRATRCQVQSGDEVIETVGSFVTAVTGVDGYVHSVSGPPNCVILRAKRCGAAALEVIVTAMGAEDARKLRIKIIVRDEESPEVNVTEIPRLHLIKPLQIGTKS
jgi:hypothetical protein